MEKRGKVILTIIVIAILVGVFYLFTQFITSSTGYAIFSDEKGEVMHCLRTKNVVFYSSMTCPGCEDQKKVLGGTLVGVKEVVCAVDRSNCMDVEIVPAWKIDGNYYYGVKSVQDLRTLSRC